MNANSGMISGGNATLFVSDMDKAVQFYTEVLGLELVMRAENHWAEVQAGSFTIGLHPRSDKAPPPGTAGAVQIGLLVGQPLEEVQRRLAEHNVEFTMPITEDEGAGRFATFDDFDGNHLYFWESPPEQS